jgi:nucleotide-binding universal stress UspA family protein
VPITFVYVVDSAILEEIAGATSKTTETIHRELEEKGRRYLDYLSRLARDRGLQTDQVVRHGIPHSEIADLAREQGVDLIIIGQVGRHRPQRILIGSVAERVIEYAPCPVLVVRHTSARR